MKTMIALLAAMAMTTLIGCSKPEEEGAAEKAGKAIDEAVEKAESSTGKKMEEMGEAIEKAGEDMQKKE